MTGGRGYILSMLSYSPSLTARRGLRILTFAATVAIAAFACGSDPVRAEPPVAVPPAPPPPPPPPPAETPIVDGDGAAGTISVDAATTYQTIDGFGTTMGHWDDPHLTGTPTSGGAVKTTASQRDAIYDLLYSPTSGIGLNRIRIHMIDQGWQTEERGRIVTDAPFPGPRASDVFNFLDEARERNPELQTFFQMGRFDNWITRDTPPGIVAAYIKTGLDYARSKGYVADWVGVSNEPSLSPPGFSGESLRDIAIVLKRLLKDDGYSSRLTAPDDVVDELGAPKASTMLANAEARAFIGSLSIHLYGDLDPTQTAALAEQYRLPLWMTEYDDRSPDKDLGWASSIVHPMIVTYNCSAVDMLFGFLSSFAYGNRQAEYITLNSTGPTYTGYTLNPAYFQMGHWSRYVKRGAVRIAAASTNPAVKVSAFLKDGKKTIVLIHSGEVSQSVRIPAGAYRLIRTQMSGSDRLTEKGLYTSAITLPKLSMTTLIER